MNTNGTQSLVFQFAKIRAYSRQNKSSSGLFFIGKRSLRGYAFFLFSSSVFTVGKPGNFPAAD
jgi:hypothetical protein